jgi:hypothetical protein
MKGPFLSTRFAPMLRPFSQNSYKYLIHGVLAIRAASVSATPLLYLAKLHVIDGKAGAQDCSEQRLKRREKFYVI